MTQIPEVGTIWVTKTSNWHRVEILFADDVTVYYGRANERSTRHNRTQVGTQEFVAAFRPAPEMITHRIWVNLRKNGSAYLSEHEEYSTDIVQSHLIEWEVEK